MDFIITRKSWQTGNKLGSSALLDSGINRKCCLGFFALACGVPREDIVDIGTLSGLDSTIPQIVKILNKDGSESYITENLMAINDYSFDVEAGDAANMCKLRYKDGKAYTVLINSEAKREELIAKFFKRAGHNVTFK